MSNPCTSLKYGNGFMGDVLFEIGLHYVHQADFKLKLRFPDLSLLSARVTSVHSHTWQKVIFIDMIKIQ